MSANPLAQFEIKPLIKLPLLSGHEVHFTNASLFMLLSVVSIMVFLGYGMRKRALVPGRWQGMAEISYEFIANMLRDNAGHESRRFFPFFFTLFMFILFANMLGMLPFYSFTVTSHIAVTFALAAFVITMVIITGFVKQGPGFLKHFLPSGTPMLLAPLVYVIELISFLARPISLSVRLFANMMAGHMLMKVIALFVPMLGLAGVVPLFFVAAITGFELFVALLQAYIFSILSCIYLSDALHSH